MRAMSTSSTVSGTGIAGPLAVSRLWLSWSAMAPVSRNEVISSSMRRVPLGFVEHEPDQIVMDMSSVPSRADNICEPSEGASGVRVMTR